MFYVLETKHCLRCATIIWNEKCIWKKFMEYPCLFIKYTGVKGYSVFDIRSLGILFVPWESEPNLQYIPRNVHTVFALLCFVVVIHWLIFLYSSGLLHWHCGNLTIAPVPAKQPRWIWMNTSCEFIMNDCITTTKPSTTKPCAYFLGYTVGHFVCHFRYRMVAKTYSGLFNWGGKVKTTTKTKRWVLQYVFA